MALRIFQNKVMAYSGKPKKQHFLQALSDVKLTMEDVRILRYWFWFPFKWIPKEQCFARSQVPMLSLNPRLWGVICGLDNGFGEAGARTRRESDNCTYRTELLPSLGFDWISAKSFQFCKSGRKCIISTPLMSRAFHLSLPFCNCCIVRSTRAGNVPCSYLHSQCLSPL